MSIYESHRRKIVSIGLMLFFGIIICGRSFKFHNDLTKESTTAHFPYKTIYKTIPDSENAIGLIDYELHEDGEYTDGEETYPTYNAVIKNIDKDDNYKSLCKDVVTDIIKTCGDKRVIVNIYDSFEAYSLAMNEERLDKFLTNEEEATINSHRVATYVLDHTNNTDEEIGVLTYYPDAKNGLKENETITSL
jgi:hypothetical protein